MLFEPKEIQLKDGRTALLRSPERADAQELLDCMRDCASETEFLMRYPEECTETEAQEAAFLDGINQSPYDVMILCIVGGELAGNCQLSFGKRIKVRHGARVAVAIREKFWKLGIGKAMFREMLALAKQRGVSRVELSYIEGNERAKHLYEKMGFVQIAEHPDAIQLKDGTLLKEIFMMRKL